MARGAGNAAALIVIKHVAEAGWFLRNRRCDGVGETTWPDRVDHLELDAR
jgi:hypothetical protein